MIMSSLTRRNRKCLAYHSIHVFAFDSNCWDAHTKNEEHMATRWLGDMTTADGLHAQAQDEAQADFWRRALEHGGHHEHAAPMAQWAEQRLQTADDSDTGYGRGEAG